MKSRIPFVGYSEKIMKIEECINYQLNNVGTKVNELFRKNLSSYGITPGQYILLYHLWNEEGKTPSQLAQLCGLDASTITGFLTLMEKKELIHRVHSKSDRRVVEVYLTQAGRDLQKHVENVIDESNVQALSMLDVQERKVLKNILGRVAKTEF